MLFNKRLAIPVVILLLTGSMHVWGFEKVGTTSFQFLKVTTNARAAGMGEAFTAVADNSEGLYFNPAAIVSVENLDFSAAYLDWFLDIYHSSLTAAYTVPGIGSFGLQALLTDAGEIRVTSVDALGFVGDTYLGYTGEVIKPGAMVLGLSYARNLTEKFSFGLTVKYAREDLGVRSTGNIAFDGGLLYDTGFRSLRLSAVIRHFGPEVKFYDEVDLARYDQSINHPDPAKIQRYIVEDNFYDAEDPIIRVARQLQYGDALASDVVEDATDRGGASHYAQALTTGMRYLQTANDFFTSDMELATLRERLDIGKPGRDGKPV